jgi:hypothetical protein
VRWWSIIERSGDGGADRHRQTRTGDSKRDIPWVEEDDKHDASARLCGWLAGKLCVSTVAAVLAGQVVSGAQCGCQLFWARAAAFLTPNWWRAPVWHASREIGIARRAGMSRVAAVHAGQHSRTNSRGKGAQGFNERINDPRHTPRVSPSIETHTITRRRTQTRLDPR